MNLEDEALFREYKINAYSGGEQDKPVEAQEMPQNQRTEEE